MSLMSNISSNLELEYGHVMMDEDLHLYAGLPPDLRPYFVEMGRRWASCGSSLLTFGSCVSPRYAEETKLPESLQGIVSAVLSAILSARGHNRNGGR